MTLTTLFVYGIPNMQKVQLPSFPLAEERVVERSDDRVSQPGGHYRQCISANIRRVDSPRLRCAGRPSLRLRRKEGSCNYLFVENTLFLNPIKITPLCQWSHQR
jgi:hypothetical protein